MRPLLNDVEYKEYVKLVNEGKFIPRGNQTYIGAYLEYKDELLNKNDEKRLDEKEFLLKNKIQSEMKDFFVDGR